MAETGYIKILGSSSSVRFLETDISGSTSDDVIGLQRNYITPVEGVTAPSDFFPDSDSLGVGIKALRTSFPNETEVEYSATIRSDDVWQIIPLATKFETVDVIGVDHTPSVSWNCYITAKVTTLTWPATTKKAYIKFQVFDDSGNNIVYKNILMTSTSYVDYVISVLPINSIQSTDKLVLQFSIGFFPSTPS